MGEILFGAVMGHCIDFLILTMIFIIKWLNLPRGRQNSSDKCINIFFFLPLN